MLANTKHQWVARLDLVSASRVHLFAIRDKLFFSSRSSSQNFQAFLSQRKENSKPVSISARLMAPLVNASANGVMMIYCTTATRTEWLAFPSPSSFYLHPGTSFITTHVSLVLWTYIVAQIVLGGRGNFKNFDRLQQLSLKFLFPLPNLCLSLFSPP